jgi:hypothetical protein
MNIEIVTNLLAFATIAVVVAGVVFIAWRATRVR